MGPLGFWELLVVFAVLLLLFGARRLPEMGKSLGRGMREFKDAVTGAEVPDQTTELPARTTTPTPTPPPTAAPTEASEPSESERVSSSSSS
jgi:sec-independent protein translocase protein TatA